MEIMDFNEITKYLGRNVGFAQPTNKDVDNRILIAWKKFFDEKMFYATKSTS